MYLRYGINGGLSDFGSLGADEPKCPEGYITTPSGGCAILSFDEEEPLAAPSPDIIPIFVPQYVEKKPTTGLTVIGFLLAGVGAVALISWLRGRK